MLQALVQQLGNNFNEIKSVVSCAFKQIKASHVVFGRAWTYFALFLMIQGQTAYLRLEHCNIATIETSET